MAHVTPHGIMRIFRSEGGDSAERLRVFVAEGSASDLFWLEMVFKGSRLPYSIEAVTDRQAAKQYLQQQTDSSLPDLILLDGVELLENLPAPKSDPLFVLADAAEGERYRERFGGNALHFIEKPFTHQKLFDCLAAAHLGTWAGRVGSLTLAAATL